MLHWADAELEDDESEFEVSLVCEGDLQFVVAVSEVGNEREVGEGEVTEVEFLGTFKLIKRL